MHRAHAGLPREFRRAFSYSVHSVRGDATNAKIGDSKAHVTEVASVFHHLPPPAHLDVLDDDDPVRPTKATNC
eukprot:9301094-Pyramimonas_sp.AAC.1